MGVGAADAERGDTRPPGPSGLGPGPLLRQQFHRAGRPVDLGGGGVDVQGARQDAVLEGQYGLDDARDARGGLGVSDVGLQRTEQERVFAVLSVGGEDRLRFDGVAQCRARAVCLHRVHVTRRQPGLGQCPPDHPLLGGAVGGGQAVGGAVLVDGRATYHRQHPVAVAPGVREPFQGQHTHALGPSRAVGGRREGLATAVHRHAALPGEGDEDAGRRHHRDTTGQRDRALSRPQGLGGQMQGHERGGTSGVHRDRRALEAERVRHPARQNTGRCAETEHALQLGGHGCHARPVVVVGHAGEDTDVRAAQGGRVQTGPLQRLPRRLQHEPLLRVHGQRLAGRDTEEPGVELTRVVQEAALLGVAGAGVVRVGMEEGVQVPTPVRREVTDAVTAVEYEVPQFLRRGHATRQPARHADDGYRLVRRRRRGDRRHHGHGSGQVVDQLLQQEGAEDLWCRVVEEEGGRQGAAGEGVETVAQLDGGGRVEADLVEHHVRFDRVRRGEPQDGRGLPADGGQQYAFLFRRGLSGEVGGEDAGVRRRFREARELVGH
ncbi:putative protein OS=Streptomyces fumanus OX=67302 GN=GCM10018772_62440 PE=4 SV=1 [Streptomyces fumanus]